jgi:predicted nuclease with TOPRIM domain
MSDVENLIIAQLQGIRRELAAMLENQLRDRQLITRLASRMEQGFGEVRRDIQDLRSDVTLLENSLLTRHNEMMQVMRRLDELGAPADELAP